MLINLTNHPSCRWEEKQINVANQQFGEIVDMAFPNIEPAASEEEISQLADYYLSKIVALANANEATIHVMGEMTFTFALINKLKALDYTCVASTSERIVVSTNISTKEVTFRFVRFRKF